MTDEPNPAPRCEPLPELRGVDGWHCLAFADAWQPLWCGFWCASVKLWALGTPIQTDSGNTPEVAYKYGFRYLAPVTPPAEVERLRAEVDRLRAMLLPFAEAAENLDDWHRDRGHIWETAAAMAIEARHLRAARAALGGTP